LQADHLSRGHPLSLYEHRRFSGPLPAAARPQKPQNASGAPLAPSLDLSLGKRLCTRPIHGLKRSQRGPLSRADLPRRQRREATPVFPAVKEVAVSRRLPLTVSVRPHAVGAHAEPKRRRGTPPGFSLAVPATMRPDPTHHPLPHAVHRGQPEPKTGSRRSLIGAIPKRPGLAESEAPEFAPRCGR